MSARIVIQHLTGSKANRIEHLTLDNLSEITLGRDVASSIRFDERGDDAVSRRHAMIRIQTEPGLAFWIADLGSRNGTRLNDEPVTSETELLPGDTVELGRGGPRFVFDMQPRPAHFAGRTRVISTSASAPTRALDTASIDAAARAAAATGTAASAGAAVGGASGAKVGVGRNTVIGMLADQRQKSNRSWMYVLAAVLAVVGLGGGGLYYHTKQEAERARIAAEARAEEARVAAEQEAQRKVEAAQARMRAEMGMNPQEVVRRFGNATVLVEGGWRLFDPESGKPVYHRAIIVRGVRFPSYIILPNGALTRWLTTDDNDGTNIPLRSAGHGSGFVITENGFIVTNKHVVADYMTPQSVLTAQGMAIVYKLGSDEQPLVLNLNEQPASSIGTSFMSDWIPSEHPVYIFGGNSRPVLLGTRPRRLEGRGDVMVSFPGNPTPTRGQVQRTSTQADIAVIKIETQQPLATIPMATDNIAKVGERVIVLGYPGFSTQTIADVRSHEPGQPSVKRQQIPEPTVTDGVIARISPPVQQQGDVVSRGTMGDVYQMTVPTGPGNSGGPVFNAAGKVIGVLTYASRSRETTTYAVPIKYARDLMQVQRTE